MQWAFLHMLPFFTSESYVKYMFVASIL